MRNLEAPRASVLGGLGTVGLGFPGVLEVGVAGFHRRTRHPRDPPKLVGSNGVGGRRLCLSPKGDPPFSPLLSLLAAVPGFL